MSCLRMYTIEERDYALGDLESGCVKYYLDSQSDEELSSTACEFCR